MNILVFTNHYPLKDKDTSTTKAVHHFTKKWVKLGHKVVVVHNYSVLHNFLTGLRWNRDVKTYNIEGVKILFLQVNRFIPKKDFIFKNEIISIKAIILKFLEKENFIPDKFVVHFCAEQWQIVESLKNDLSCKPIPIFHNCDIKSNKRIKKIISSCDKIGFRSKKIKEKLLSVIDKQVDMFQVSSGAPDVLFSDMNTLRKNPKNVGNFKKILYVGNLIPLKNVGVTLHALAELKNEHDFIFNIVGSGKSEHALKRLVEKLSLKDKVLFHSRLEREKVLNLMMNSDCFVMVSKPETFGIVYIEAMACECFVIGSKGEGIDGIIKNYETGLLIEPNNVSELKEGLEYFFKLDFEQLKIFKKKAYYKASNFTESAVAEEYLKNIIV